MRRAAAAACLVAALLASLGCGASASAAPAPQADYAARAFALLDRLVTCDYAEPLGTFPTEALWQSGNTLEALSTATALLRDGTGEAAAPGRVAAWLALMNNSFARTPVIVDQCFDDHQWWLHAWVRASEVSGELAYAERAAAVFDFVVSNGWSPSFCGGGVDWCPVSGSDKPYKNAVTSELFFAAAMALAPHEASLGKPAGFYVAWAEQAWAWLDASGMQGADGLFNDGLTQDSCTNNQQTTWTYDQAMALSGLGRLALAQGGNATLVAAAARLFSAATTLLTVAGGILAEPCGNSCDNDQHIFKGVWARHAAYLARAQPPMQLQAATFLDAQARSLIANASCATGGYGNLWQGPACASHSTASDSAALDLLLAAAELAPPSSAAWHALGVGACVDAQARAMPSCSAIVAGGEAACRAAAEADAAAVAYELETGCLGVSVCAVSTTAASCAPGWTRSAGSGATSVSAVDGKALAMCVLRA
jgi:hypothetical protein